jgi:hypothetical protein
MKFTKLIFLFFILSTKNFAQKNQITVIDSNQKTSLRGLSVVDNNVIWASGSNGTVARSINGGKSFQWLTVKGFEKRDFRDIEAFDDMTALVMAVGEPGIILKTKDGGQNWYKVFESDAAGIFLDAMDFADKKAGMVIGDPLVDPIAHKVFIGATWDGGDTWLIPKYPATLTIPDAQVGEAFFASSGTNIKIQKKGGSVNGAFVSGGRKSRLFMNEEIDSLPIIQGGESTGANSIDLDYSNKKGVIVGGDFAKDTDATANCVLLTWKDTISFSVPETPPHGYRSCVIYISDSKLLTCGTSGVDISNDGGNNWQLISGESFNVCKKAKSGNAVFLAGANGRIARFNYLK